jgi:hypothetical protein
MLAEVSEVNGLYVWSWQDVEREREAEARSFAHVKPSRVRAAAAAIGTELARATNSSELRAALSLVRQSIIITAAAA